ncbi:MAG TPA: hypothetical protein VFP08_04525 [Acidimicrobiales bacterium]|nr:hypothetical protein [Acidimicrobiales bacterium]
MGLKARVLVPAGALAATLLATACVPPPVDPGTTTTTGATTPTPTTTGSSVPPPPTCPNVNDDATPGPNSQNPKSSWGVNGAGYAAVIIDDVVYVGGTFGQAFSPNGGQTQPRANLAAFCLANGSLLSTFVANTNGQVWALTTDGTSLFAGGNFTTVNGGAANRLVKLNPATGQVDTTFNPPAIPDVVYALGYRSANASVYAGGDFSIAGSQGKKGASFHKDTGAVTGWNPNADGRIESLEISPDQSTVFIGGSFDNVGGSPHNALAQTDASSGAAAPIVYSRASMPGSGLIQGRIFSIAVGGPTNATPYVAIGPAKPGGTNGGNKFASYDPATGNATWEQNGPDGDGQAIELINGTLFGGFHGGWNGNAAKRITGLNIANGAPTPFQPNSGGVLGVRGMAQGGGRLIAVGDFNFMGATGQVRGLAIFD